MAAARQARKRSAPAGRRSGTVRERSGADAWLAARHDFRQPVQTLMLLADGLGHARNEDARRRYAAGIAQVAAALGHMVAGMTLIARLAVGEAQPQAVPVALGPVVMAMLGDLEAVAVAGRGRIVPGALDGTARADPALLEAALRGLLLYAIKFAEGGDIVVTTRATRAAGREGDIEGDGGGSVALELTFAGLHADTALSGMAFVELPPPDDARNEPWVGLGPTFVAAIAHHMSGDLALDSCKEGRARIVLSLPSA